MSENLKMACQLVEQGHVRVGPEVIKDPAFLVTRYSLLFLFNKEFFNIKICF